ncbi:MAG TPA: class I SAM-dependent methyltransferase [Rhodanobacter sp.]|nr:class I SAM-dependent methyltransferase [Rhodanobacter sp.]
MTVSEPNFVATQYAPRAQEYLHSAAHSSGADLDQVEAALRGRDSARVLDLGCGGGHITYRAAPHVASVVACDVTSTMLAVVAETATARGHANVTTQQAAAENLPFESASFDVVLARYTSHHWDDLDAGLREARRVLKPDGLAIFIDVVAPGSALLDTHLQTLELLRDGSHVRNYSTPEWIAAITHAGFSVETLTPRKLHLAFDAWIARTHTSAEHVVAIRLLQRAAPASVREHFATAADGSFNLDTLTLTARVPTRGSA